jgi:hypothetical protein
LWSQRSLVTILSELGGKVTTNWSHHSRAEIQHCRGLSSRNVWYAKCSHVGERTSHAFGSRTMLFDRAKRSWRIAVLRLLAGCAAPDARHEEAVDASTMMASVDGSSDRALATVSRFIDVYAAR